MRFVVADTHHRMALAIIRELGKAFPSCEIVSVSNCGNRPLGHFSKYTTETVTISENGYKENLLKLSKNSKDLLIPAGMQSLRFASKSSDEFYNKFEGLWPKFGALENAADKLFVAKTAKELGLSVPAEYPLSDPVFPCVVKFRNGEALKLPAHKRYKIAKNERDYEKAVSELRNDASQASSKSPKIERNENQAKPYDIFVSQYVSGCAYGVSAVLDKNSLPLAVFSHKRIREYPLSGGPASCAESIWHIPLVEAGLRLFKSLELVGFAMAEFKGDLEKPYLLEVNPRVWGTFPLSSISGAGLSKAYVLGAIGELHPFEQLPEKCPYEVGKRMQFLANDFLHCLTSLKKGRIVLGVLRDMISKSVKGGVFDKKDMGGNLAYLRNLVFK